MAWLPTTAEGFAKQKALKPEVGGLTSVPESFAQAPVTQTPSESAAAAAITPATASPSHHRAVFGLRNGHLHRALGLSNTDTLTGEHITRGKSSRNPHVKAMSDLAE